MAKAPTPPIVSNGDNSIFFERYLVTSRELDTCIIVNAKEENALLLKDGIAYDTIQGGRNYIFDKKELKNDEVARVEVIFMSKSAKVQILWGTSLEVLDPVYDETITIGINGSYEIQVGNPRQFYEVLVGRDSVYSKTVLKERIKARMMAVVKNAVDLHMSETNMSYLRFNQNLLTIAEGITPALRKALREEYGLAMGGLVIENIAIDEEGKKRLLAKKAKLDNKAEEDERKKTAREDFIVEREHGHKVDMRVLDVMEKAATAKPAESNEIKCPHCGASVPKTNKFCGECGKSPKNICPKCKLENPLTQKFCGECGEKLH